MPVHAEQSPPNPRRPVPSSAASGAPLIGVFGCATNGAEVEAVAPSVAGGWMGMGPKVREFEESFGERLGSGFVMVDSGSNALQLAIAALRLPPGSEIVLPSLTWVACAHAVVLAGHVPVFADVEAESANLDPASVALALTPRTAAIMVVHYAGKPADMGALGELGLPVIEDAAHAVDSTLAGRRCGTIGAVGVFSFDSVKNLATPDGGGVASADDELLVRARALRYCGIGSSGFARSGSGTRWWEYETVEPFPRVIPNDVSASIALVQLVKLARNQERRAAIWRRYQQELGRLGWLRTPVEAAPDERHSYFTYLIRVLDGRRDALAQRLLESGIYTTFRYPPLHRTAAYRTEARLPQCEQLAEQGLNLPLHPRLSDDDVERVIDAVSGF